jgi:hypothetical protein
MTGLQWFVFFLFGAGCFFIGLAFGLGPGDVNSKFRVGARSKPGRDGLPGGSVLPSPSELGTKVGKPDPEYSPLSEPAASHSESNRRHGVFAGNRVTRLWFRQSLRDTGWLLLHPQSLRQFWRVLRGRCGYCGKADCID